MDLMPARWCPIRPPLTCFIAIPVLTGGFGQEGIGLGRYHLAIDFLSLISCIGRTGYIRIQIGLIAVYDKGPRPIPLDILA